MRVLSQVEGRGGGQAEGFFFMLSYGGDKEEETFLNSEGGAQAVRRGGRVSGGRGTPPLYFATFYFLI